MRAAFLVAQVSMSVLLLIVAGLAVRSVRNAHSIDTGFDSHGARGRDFIRALHDRLNTAPGIESWNVVAIIPLTLSNTTTYLLRSGDPQPAAGEAPVTPQIYTNGVGPGHFRTLRIPLLSGRDFSHTDADERFDLAARPAQEFAVFHSAQPMP